MSPVSTAGKVELMQRMFGRTFRDYAITPKKDVFANSGVVLIDDLEPNIISFCKAGGVGILFPALTNVYHRSPDYQLIRKDVLLQLENFKTHGVSSYKPSEAGIGNIVFDSYYRMLSNAINVSEQGS